jgi:hypothetical protein
LGEEHAGFIRFFVYLCLSVLIIGVVRFQILAVKTEWILCFYHTLKRMVCHRSRN